MKNWTGRLLIVGKADLKIVNTQADLDRGTWHERKGKTLHWRVNFAEISRSFSIVVVAGWSGLSVVMVGGRSRFAYYIESVPSLPFGPGKSSSYVAGNIDDL